MQTVTGVGPVTAWTVLAYLNEITTVNRNQLTALVGLAPYNRDSGKYQGKRFIQGGRQKVRDCLYMATRTAAIHTQKTGKCPCLRHRCYSMGPSGRFPIFQTLLCRG